MNNKYCKTPSNCFSNCRWITVNQCRWIIFFFVRRNPELESVPHSLVPLSDFLQTVTVFYTNRLCLCPKYFLLLQTRCPATWKNSKSPIDFSHFLRPYYKIRFILYLNQHPYKWTWGTDDVGHDVIVIFNLPCKSMQIRIMLQILKSTCKTSVK